MAAERPLCKIEVMEVGVLADQGCRGGMLVCTPFVGQRCGS